MGWVTLDDGQHVYIGSSGRVLATRSQISSGPGGGKERGKALAARSKAAIGRATGKVRAAAESGKQADFMSKAISMHGMGGQSKRFREATQERFRQELFGKKGLQIEGPKQPTEAESLNRQAAQLRDLASRGMKPRAYAKKADELEAKAKALSQQSPATTRAIGHAKAAGPTLREQADAARADRQSKPAYYDKLLGKVAARRGRVPTAQQALAGDKGHNEGVEAQHKMIASVNKQGKLVTDRLVGALNKQQSPATTRAIEHAKDATIGHTPGEKFSLIQRAATTNTKTAVNTGKGVTKFMFDMKRGDKRGQTSFLK